MLFFTEPGSAAPEEPSDDEEEMVTGMAIHDLAAQRGARPEDIAIRTDAARATEMRDRALREYLERKERMQREREQREG